MKINYELTDTFGGQSNYAWVKRASVDAPDNLTDLAIVRRAKKWAELNGMACTVYSNYGDGFAIYPRHACVVLFVTFEE